MTVKAKVSRKEVEDGKILFRTEGWLSRAEQSFREAFLSECQWSRAAPATPIARGGEATGGMYGVALGAVGVIPVVAAPDAGLIHISRAPFWFGLHPFVSGEGRHVTVLARSDCLVAHVSQPALARILAQHPVGWQMLVMHLSALFRVALQSTADLLLPDRDRRCAAVLLRLAGARDTGASAHPVQCSHEELAAMCNLSRQTIAEVLKRFEAQGLAQLRYRSIRLLKPDIMRRHVDGG